MEDLMGRSTVTVWLHFLQRTTVCVMNNLMAQWRAKRFLAKNGYLIGSKRSAINLR